MIAVAPIQSFLELLQPLHDHLCPRQVLGVRMGMLAADLLDISLLQADKRLFCFVETDGCFVDGITVTTGCSLGHRTLRLMDYGKVAATFVDTHTQHAVRVWPQSGIREHAKAYALDAPDAWHAQLDGYQIMPAAELLNVEAVTLTISLQALISSPGRRVTCANCGEEIMNQRELCRDGQILCIPCAGNRYCKMSEAQESG